MKTNVQTGENHPASRRDSRCPKRRSLVFRLVLLLLASGGTTMAVTVQVEVGHDQFVPYGVTIHPGDTVQWTWTTDHFSSVTSGLDAVPNGLFDSGIRLRPYTFSYTFQSAGKFDYFCQVDPINMIGVVEVVAPTAPSTLGNISTRLRVQSGDNALIGGMIATGTGGKRVIIRAVGP